jgi:hypothetical protein
MAPKRMTRLGIDRNVQEKGTGKTTKIFDAKLHALNATHAKDDNDKRLSASSSKVKIWSEILRPLVREPSNAFLTRDVTAKTKKVTARARQIYWREDSPLHSNSKRTFSAFLFC